MQTTLRKIGNSRGVIIPSAYIEQLRIKGKVELTLENGVLILKPVTPQRQGWFEGYDPSKDTVAISDIEELESEQEEWEW